MTNNTNKACCSIPPVQSDYKPKGSFEDVEGLKCYTVGDKSSKKALLVIFDIFGFWPQTQQGSDLLSTLGYRVVMPDFFRGKPFDQEKFPPKNDQDKKELQDFFGGPANPEKVTPEAISVAKALKKDGAESVSILGYCWGGKVSLLATIQSDEFNSVSILHPAMLDPSDAEKLSVPVCALPSQDESKEDVSKFEKKANEKPFASKNFFKTYSDMHHGWAAARADLKDENNKKRFHEAYEDVGNFLCKL